MQDGDSVYSSCVEELGVDCVGKERYSSDFRFDETWKGERHVQTFSKSEKPLAGPSTSVGTHQWQCMYGSMRG